MTRTGGSYERRDGKLVLKHRTAPAGSAPPAEPETAKEPVERKAAGGKSRPAEAATTEE